MIFKFVRIQQQVNEAYASSKTTATSVFLDSSSVLAFLNTSSVSFGWRTSKKKKKHLFK